MVAIQGNISVNKILKQERYIGEHRLAAKKIRRLLKGTKITEKTKVTVLWTLAARTYPWGEELKKQQKVPRERLGPGISLVAVYWLSMN